MFLFKSEKVGFDRILLIAALLLLCIGLVVISSASSMEAQVKFDDAFYQTKKHIIAIGIALIVGFVCATIPTSFYKEHALKAIFIILLMLIMVLAVGREINGAKRWLSLGIMNLQPSELLKLCWILYFSGYVSKHIESVSKTIKGFLMPFAILLGFLVSLYLQPDFGSVVVLAFITTALLWIAGAGLIKYIVVILILALASVVSVILSPYRVKRVTSFLDPWQDQFGSSFQLTQSLMAYGRGGLFGQGLGNSNIKQGYLPEAHTDFITAILGEEFGFVGMLVLLLLEGVIVYKAVKLGMNILKNDAIYQGYVAFGIGMWFFLQTVINVGVASGALPTKGLTIPLVSYGGSSLMVSVAAIAILLRIDFEFKNKIIGDKR